MPTGPHVFESRFQARSYELDAFGHVNHAVFLNWLEQARFDVFEQGGFPASELHARGWGVYVVKLEVEYLKEARQGDVLIARTRVAESTRTTIQFAQVLSPAGSPDVVSLSARVRAAWIGADRRPARVPPEVRAALGID
jgi:YbgC/YbaW family acyl-CoA thioester hydrolase